MKNRKANKRLRARQKDYDTHLVGKPGFRRPGSNKK